MSFNLVNNYSLNTYTPNPSDSPFQKQAGYCAFLLTIPEGPEKLDDAIQELRRISLNKQNKELVMSFNPINNDSKNVYTPVPTDSPFLKQAGYCAFLLTLPDGPEKLNDAIQELRRISLSENNK